jgi:hypothetical protein
MHGFEGPGVPPEFRIHVGSILDSQTKQIRGRRLGRILI